MKAALGVCLMTATALSGISAEAQSARGRMPRHAQSLPAAVAGQAMSFHNPYTSGTVSADFLMPDRARPVAAVVLLTGAQQREQSAAASLRRFLGEHGYAVMTLPAVTPTGATEEDSLNTVAALHYLETRQDLQGAPVGLVGYGDGVRLAAVAAAQGNPAGFLVLLGGAVVPDRLNSLPDNLARGALGRDEAIRSLEHVRCPVFILLGEYDGFGTHRTVAENAAALRSILDAGHHNNYVIRVLNDSDSLLAETGAGGSSQSNTAAPPTTVWKTTTDWLDKETRALDSAGGSDTVETNQSKPVRVYPKSIYGPFNWRPSYVWQPAIGDQPRPFGFWYW